MKKEVTIHLRVPAPLLALLKAEAERRDVSLSQIVRELLTDKGLSHGK